ncbi:MAG: DUF937 domain-containing protein [Prevotellaceae bacterium]|jgi:hypothetical protein|nr:DUF937 domain-containing protein [Prevotellaceae bacterium]
MANLLDILNSDLGKQIVSGIGKQTGATQKETSSVLSSALPAMLDGMHKNALQGGADGILNALGKHDGSILNNVTDFLGGGSQVATDGKGILGHIFGDQLGAVADGISKQSGVSKTKTSSILEMAAPIVMGYLGKQTKSSGVKNGGGLASVLGGLLSSAGGGGIVTSLLDQNGDGKLDINDIASVVTGTRKGNSSGLGGLLGGIFGKHRK